MQMLFKRQNRHNLKDFSKLMRPIIARERVGAEDLTQGLSHAKYLLYNKVANPALSVVKPAPCFKKNFFRLISYTKNLHNTQNLHATQALKPTYSETLH